MRRHKALFFSLALTTASGMLLLSGCEGLLDETDTGDPRDRLVDTWKVDEQSSTFKSAAETYWVEIEKDPSTADRVIIYDFYNVGNASVIVDGNNLSLPSQTIGDGFTVSGQGVVQGKGNQIAWTYQVDDGSGELDNVTATYTRLTF